MEYGREPIGTETRMRTGAPVVEHRDLLTDVRVPAVGHAFRIFAIREVDRGMRAIAERLDR
jgi:hypothetical protein